MISEKQLNANRANAQKSCGPKTEAGKCKTRFNARCHDLTGQILVLTEEQQPHFDRLKKAIVDEFVPATDHERSLVELYATFQWRLHRAAAVEEGMFSLALMEDIAGNLQIENSAAHQAIGNAKTFRDQASAFNLLGIYGQRLLNQSQKVLKQLHETQQQRKQREEVDLDEAERLYHLNQMLELPFDPQENGFVFSAEQLRLHRHRKELHVKGLVAKGANYNRLMFEKHYPKAAA